MADKRTPPKIRPGDEPAIRTEVGKLRASVRDLAAKFDQIATTVEQTPKKNGFWSRIWAERNFITGVSAVIVTVALALLGFFFAGFRAYMNDSFDSHLKPLGDRLDALSERVAKVEGRLQIASALVQSNLEQVAKLPPNEFQDHLSSVGKILATAKTNNLPIPSPTVSALRSRLVESNPNVPGFWSAAASVIDYSAPIRGSKLPACFNFRPAGNLLRARPREFKIESVGPTWAHCSLDLNAPIPPGIQRIIDEMYSTAGSLQPYLATVCEHCQVAYSGGTIPLLSDRIKRLALIECVFNFEPDAVPTAPGSLVAKQVLQASDASRILIEPGA